MFLDYRYEERSVWSSRNTERGTPYWVGLSALILTMVTFVRVTR